MTELIVRPTSDKMPAGEFEELVLLLQEDLTDSGYQVVPVPGGPAPVGSRGVDPAELGNFVVTVVSSAGVAQILAIIRDWLSRQPDVRKVKIVAGTKSIELEAATEQQQEQLIEAFIADLDQET